MAGTAFRREPWPGSRRSPAGVSESPSYFLGPPRASTPHALGGVAASVSRRRGVAVSGRVFRPSFPAGPIPGRVRVLPGRGLTRALRIDGRLPCGVRVPPRLVPQAAGVCVRARPSSRRHAASLRLAANSHCAGCCAATSPRAGRQLRRVLVGNCAACCAARGIRVHCPQRNVLPLPGEPVAAPRGDDTRRLANSSGPANNPVNLRYPMQCPPAAHAAAAGTSAQDRRKTLAQKLTTPNAAATIRSCLPGAFHDAYATASPADLGPGLPAAALRLRSPLVPVVPAASPGESADCPAGTAPRSRIAATEAPSHSRLAMPG